MTNEITVYPESYGCTSNRNDLEIMLGILEQSGYRIVTDPSKADVIIINTCAVKEPTQKRMLHRIASIHGKPLIISGCLPKIDLEAIKQVAPDYSAVLDPQSIHRISSVVEQASRSIRNLQYFSVNPPPKPTLPKKRLNPYVEIIQIAEGCLGDCSYCCTKHARGKLHSFPKTSIIERAKNAVSNGAREIWLTAQDTGAYGIDHGTNLSSLMREINKLDGDFRIRLGMMNPHHAATMIDDLCEIIRDAKTYKFLHIPVQSGSEKILRHMKRQYEPEEFKRLVRRLRSRIPNLTLSTDIIVGYPTETDEDFQSTIDLITETRPDITNISKYSSRPRTGAAKLTPLPGNILKARSRTTTCLGSRISLERNQRMIGKREEITPVDTTSRGKLIGRTDNYKKTIIDEKAVLGTKIPIRVSKAFPRHLEGVILCQHTHAKCHHQECTNEM